MKNIIELYNGYYDIYKNDYGSKDALSVAEKKKFDPKQFKAIGKKKMS